MSAWISGISILHRGTGKDAYLNLDQDHLTISVAGEQVFDADLPTDAERPA